MLLDAGKGGWYMGHLFAVLALTLACLVAILWLALVGEQVPETFTLVATGGATYIIGTQTGAKHASKKPDDGE